MDKPENEMAHQVLLKAIEQTPVRDWMTQRELELLDKGFKTWDYASDVYETQNRWESLGLLLWSLRIFKDIPQYGDYFSKKELFRVTAIIPTFPQTITGFVEYFSTGHGSKPDHFVDEIEFSKAISEAEAWHWRARAQLVLDFKKSTEKSKSKDLKIPRDLRNVMMHIEKAIELGSERALGEKLIKETIEGDFKIKGIPYKNLDDHGLRDIANLTEARLAALGWISGTHDWEYNRGDLQFINPLGSLWNPE